VTGDELDPDARAELLTLPKDLATRVARHLVMAGRLVDEDAAEAYKHARAARRLASRVGVVREACGFAAYHAGEWADALAELRAARRLPGREDAYLPVMADCERGLGRPERALDLAKSPEAKRLATPERVELRIVESGARRDLGQYAVAVVTLQIPELKDRRLRPWSVRLLYAYADALAAAADRDGDTDAAERLADLEGLEIIDTEEGEPEDALAEPATGDVAGEPVSAGDEAPGGLGVGGEPTAATAEPETRDAVAGSSGRDESPAWPAAGGEQTDDAVESPDAPESPAGEAVGDTRSAGQKGPGASPPPRGAEVVISEAGVPGIEFGAQQETSTVTPRDPVPEVAFSPPPSAPPEDPAGEG
jgi:hypothetical protein